MAKEKYYIPSDYAKLKKVTPSRITALRSKLITKAIAKKWFVKDCFQNDMLFNKPSFNANRRG